MSDFDVLSLSEKEQQLFLRAAELAAEITRKSWYAEFARILDEDTDGSREAALQRLHALASKDSEAFAEGTNIPEDLKEIYSTNNYGKKLILSRRAEDQYEHFIKILRANSLYESVQNMVWKYVDEDIDTLTHGGNPSIATLHNILFALTLGPVKPAVDDTLKAQFQNGAAAQPNTLEFLDNFMLICGDTIPAEPGKPSVLSPQGEEMLIRLDIRFGPSEWEKKLITGAASNAPEPGAKLS